MEADFVAFEQGKVTIRRQSDDKVFVVPLDTFSDADQDYVRSQQEVAFDTAAARTAWAMAFSNCIVTHDEVYPTYVHNSAKADRYSRMMRTLFEDERMSKIGKALGMSAFETANNIFRFAGDDENVFLDHAVALIEDSRTKQLAGELETSYNLFVFIAASCAAGKEKLLPRISDAAAPAKELSSQIDVETGRIALAAGASPHEVSVFFKRATAAIAEDEHLQLAARLGQKKGDFVLNLAGGTMVIDEYLRTASQAVEIADALTSKTGVDRSKLGAAALESVHTPKEYGARVEQALGCAEMSAVAQKIELAPGLCAVLAGHSMLDPAAFLKRLNSALDAPQLAAVVEATELYKSYLALMAAESRLEPGLFFDSVLNGMESDKCKKTSKDTGVRLCLCATISAFATRND